MAIESIITVLAAGFLGVLAVVIFISWVMYKLHGGARYVPAAAMPPVEASLYKIVVKPQEAGREIVSRAITTEFSNSAPKRTTHTHSPGIVSGTSPSLSATHAPPRLQIVHSTGESTFSGSPMEAKYGYAGNYRINA